MEIFSDIFSKFQLERWWTNARLQAKITKNLVALYQTTTCQMSTRAHGHQQKHKQQFIILVASHCKHTTPQ